MASSMRPSSNRLPLMSGGDPGPCDISIWYLMVRLSETSVMSSRNGGIFGYWSSVFGSAWLYGGAPAGGFTTLIVRIRSTRFFPEGTVALGEPDTNAAVPGLAGALTRISTRLPGARG